MKREEAAELDPEGEARAFEEIRRLRDKLAKSRSRDLIGEDVPEAGLKRGDPIPDGWPTFEEGELIPIKGHHFNLVRVTADDELVLKHQGMTKAEKRRRSKR
jgi:hypothetical protein